MSPRQRGRQGFASFSPAKLHAATRKGGLRVHQLGRSYEWTSTTAKAARAIREQKRHK